MMMVSNREISSRRNVTSSRRTSTSSLSASSMAADDLTRFRVVATPAASAWTPSPPLSRWPAASLDSSRMTSHCPSPFFCAFRLPLLMRFLTASVDMPVSLLPRRSLWCVLSSALTSPPQCPFSVQCVTIIAFSIGRQPHVETIAGRWLIRGYARGCQQATRREPSPASSGGPVVRHSSVARNTWGGTCSREGDWLGSAPRLARQSWHVSSWGQEWEWRGLGPACRGASGSGIPPWPCPTRNLSKVHYCDAVADSLGNGQVCALCTSTSDVPQTSGASADQGSAPAPTHPAPKWLVKDDEFRVGAGPGYGNPLPLPPLN